MTAFYGSTAMPRIIFGEGELLQAFYKVMEERTPGIWELNKALLDLWQPNAYSHDWVLPDNFHVHVKVMDSISNSIDFMGNSYEIISKVNAPTPTGLSIGANVVHSIDAMVVRELSRRCDFNLAKKAEIMELILTTPDHTAERRIERSTDSRLVQTLLHRATSSGFLSARILDHINEGTIHLCDANQREQIWALLESMPEKPFKVLAVHDCFRVHPNYANDLRSQYNQVLYEISQSQLLQNIGGQILGEEVIVNKRDDISKDILETNYALS